MVGRQIRKLDADKKKIVMSGAARYDEFLHLHNELPKATFVSGNALVGFMREHKELEEIGILRAAAEACQRAVETTLKEAREGITVDELSAATERALRQATGAGWARARFGKDTAAPLIWAPERRLARGDVIVLEATAELHGYKARVVRTGTLGPASGRMKLVYSTLRKAQDQMMERMKMGHPWSHVDRIGRSILGGGGFSKMIRALLGRGIGLDHYEPPYLAPGYHDVTALGHVVSLDPAVYTPNDYGIEAGEMMEITTAGARLMTKPPEGILEIS
jgi:Xaa-Pro aminopeptidase